MAIRNRWNHKNTPMPGCLTFKDLIGAARVKAGMAPLENGHDTPRWRSLYHPLATYSIHDERVREILADEGIELDRSSILSFGRPISEVHLVATLDVTEEMAVTVTARTFFDPKSFKNSKLFRMLAESGICPVPPIVENLIRPEGKVVWNCADLGLPNLKPLETLFDEFAGASKIVKGAVEEDDSLLDPYPFNRAGFRPAEMLGHYNAYWFNHWLVPVNFQAEILSRWTEQLHNDLKDIASRIGFAAPQLSREPVRK